MDLGLAHFLTDYGMPPAELARMVEERGFESLFLPEHTHIPVSRETPYPGGDELPPEYSHTLDLFVSLAAAATATERLKVGSGVCLVIERDPIITAKEVATLDHVSGGRVLFGIGAGWNIEEMANHGTDPKTRFRRMRESVEAMKAIWTHEEAEYHGRIIDFDPIWCWPKPVQKPHPPVLVGGVGEKVLDRVVAYGDEWIPNRVRSPEELAPRIAELQHRAEAAGREPIPVTVFGAKPERGPLERLEAAGVTRSLFYVRPEEPGEVERQLDELAKLAADWAA
jgi:probable F420-dependent oxidoreductase